MYSIRSLNRIFMFYIHINGYSWTIHVTQYSTRIIIDFDVYVTQYSSTRIAKYDVHVYSILTNKDL